MENNKYPKPQNSSTYSADKDTLQDETLQKDELLNANDMIDQITFVIDEGDEWTKILQETDELIADFNRDSIEDSIEIIYEEKEGTKYIKQFKLLLSGSKNPFIISDYDASFQKIEVIDVDQDSNDELIVMFDTHGGGGQGTHDLYVIKFNTDEIIAKKINTTDTSSLKMKLSWNIDDIYDIEKIEFGGTEKLLVCQYIWGENGHADMIGNLISIVSFDDESNIFVVEEAWMES